MSRGFSIKQQKKISFSLLFTLIKEIVIILGIYFAGEAVALLLGTKFPGSVIGMLLLLAALHLKWIKVDDIRFVSSFLLGYMPLFFIPAGASVMVSYVLMDGFYFQIIAITMVSTVLVMALTGLVVQYFVRKEKSQ